MFQQISSSLIGVCLRLWQRRVLVLALVLTIVFLVAVITPGSEAFAACLEPLGQGTGGTCCPGC
jgi:hypothetical protein